MAGIWRLDQTRPDQISGGVLLRESLLLGIPRLRLEFRLKGDDETVRLGILYVLKCTMVLSFMLR